MTRKGANMKLVNQGVGKGPLKRPIALPIIAPGIGYDTFHPHRDIVAPARRGPPVVRVRDCYGKSVRVEKHLLGVKPKSAVRIERTMSPVSIHLAQLYVGDEGMPVVIGAMPVGLQRNDPCGPGGILVIEKEQLAQNRMLREYAEIDAPREDRRPERSARTRCNVAGAHGPHHACLSSGRIGVTFPIGRQYSRIAQSEEKRPTCAVLRMAIRVQAF